MITLCWVRWTIFTSPYRTVGSLTYNMVEHAPRPWAPAPERDAALKLASFRVASPSGKVYVPAETDGRPAIVEHDLG